MSVDIVVPESGWRPEPNPVRGASGLWEYWNHPPLAAIYRESKIHRDLHSALFDRPCIVLQEGDLQVPWCSSGPHTAGQQAFIRKLWRLTARIATNRLRQHNHEAGEVEAEARPQQTWVGNLALAWAGESPTHVVTEHSGTWRNPELMRVPWGFVAADWQPPPGFGIGPRPPKVGESGKKWEKVVRTGKRRAEVGASGAKRRAG